MSAAFPEMDKVLLATWEIVNVVPAPDTCQRRRGAGAHSITHSDTASYPSSRMAFPSSMNTRSSSSPRKSQLSPLVCSPLAGDLMGSSFSRLDSGLHVARSVGVQTDGATR